MSRMNLTIKVYEWVLHTLDLCLIYLLIRKILYICHNNILVYDIHQEPYNRFWFSILFLSNAVQ